MSGIVSSHQGRLASLGDPFALPCGLRVPNRIAKAAMTEKLAGPDGHPSDAHLTLYRRFARGGAGLMLTGNVIIDHRYLEALGNVVVEDESAIGALTAWAEAGRSYGAAFLMQINHAGRQTPRSVASESIAPSAVPLRMRTFFSVPRAMTEMEIGDAIQCFARTARIAELAGFSGVQVHAAHGYLISQFLSPRVNRRTDQWGGPIANRARVLYRVIERIRAQVSSSFAVSVKLNVEDFVKGGLTPGDALEVARSLAPLGVDLLELSGGTHELAASFGLGVERKEEAYFVRYARQIREVSSVPIMLTGGIRTRAAMASMLREGTCDLVGLARPLAIDPDLPRRLLSGDANAARELRLKVSSDARGALAELAWCNEQLARMSKGQEPKLNASAKLALLRMLFSLRTKARARRTYLSVRARERSQDALASSSAVS